MRNRNWQSSLGSALVLALALSAILALLAVTPALADDAAPPSEAAPAEGPASGGTAASADGEPVGATEEAAAESAAASGEEVAVLDEDGAVLPLASEQASALVTAADPIWCPAGVAPIASTGGCSPSFPDFNTGGLISWLITDDPNVAGVIWIEYNYDSDTAVDGSVVLDGLAFTTMDTFALTLKGGWKTPATAGTTACGGTFIDTCDPSVFKDSLSISNWSGAITISDIAVTTAVSNPTGVVSDADGAGTPALYVKTSGSITLTRVAVYNNKSGTNMAGAFLEHGGTGTVAVADSQFNDNDRVGLAIASLGAVTLKNVVASGSDLYAGTSIRNSVAAFKPVTITNGTFTLNGAGDAGLSILSKGAVTLTNINASQNAQHGADINNCDYSSGCTAVGALKILGVNNFSRNSGIGLMVWSNGAVTINQSVADGNGSYGILIDTYGATLPQNVTFTGSVRAVGNGNDGINVSSKGAVTLANVTASDNGSSGLNISNDPADPGKPVTLTGLNVFSGNGYVGVLIYSRGAVTLSNVRAVGNGFISTAGLGARIFNAQDTAVQQNVTFTGVNVFTDNYEHGLRVTSYGAVTLNNVTAIHNGEGFSNEIGSGVYIENQGGLLIKPVVINGLNNQFNRNDAEGLYILSDGAVTLYNLTAHDNDLQGVVVDNQSVLGLMPAVTFSGQSSFGHNEGFGLWVNSDGPITLNKVTTSWNNGGGAYLDNSTPPALTSPGVSLLGYFNGFNNWGTALYVSSDGAIAGANLTATDSLNFGYGVQLNNGGAPTPKPVTLTGLNLFQNNGLHGLDIWTRGAVTLNNVTALRNGSFGVWITNNVTGVDEQSNVTLNGINVFNHNTARGLSISSYGAVTVNNVTAHANGNYGVFVSNEGGTLPKPVLFQGTNSFVDNDFVGSSIASDGAVTYANVTSSYNTGSGIDANNVGPELQAPVTITGYGVFEFNDSHGLLVSSNGAVLLGNLTATENDEFGAYISTVGLTSAQPVTISGTNNFFGNGNQFGLRVASDGAITVNNLSSIANNSGAYLYNAGGGFGAHNVTLTGYGFFTGNSSGSGLWVTTNGNITLTRIWADGNASAGIDLRYGGNMILTCSGGFGNGGSGLQLFEDYPDAPLETLTLNGWQSYGNASPDAFGALLVTAKVCP